MHFSVVLAVGFLSAVSGDGHCSLRGEWRKTWEDGSYLKQLIIDGSGIVGCFASFRSVLPFSGCGYMIISLREF